MRGNPAKIPPKQPLILSFPGGSRNPSMLRYALLSAVGSVRSIFFRSSLSARLCRESQASKHQGARSSFSTAEIAVDKWNFFLHRSTSPLAITRNSLNSLAIVVTHCSCNRERTQKNFI